MRPATILAQPAAPVSGGNRSSPDTSFWCCLACSTGGGSCSRWELQQSTWVAEPGFDRWARNRRASRRPPPSRLPWPSLALAAPGHAVAAAACLLPLPSSTHVHPLLLPQVRARPLASPHPRPSSPNTRLTVQVVAATLALGLEHVRLRPSNGVAHRRRRAACVRRQVPWVQRPQPREELTEQRRVRRGGSLVGRRNVGREGQRGRRVRQGWQVRTDACGARIPQHRQAGGRAMRTEQP